MPKPFVEAVAAAILATPDDTELFATTLGLAATLCFRTEAHKRIMYDAGVATAAVGVLGTHVDHTAVLRASMGLLRNVVTNDDRSEPMSKAFDFARELHEAGLSTAVLAVARANASNGGVTADAFSVLRSVCVNNTICTEVVEEGKVLDLVTDAMTTMQADTKVTGAGASLLRTLAGNDDNKKLIGAADSPSLKVLLQVRLHVLGGAAATVLLMAHTGMWLPCMAVCRAGDAEAHGRRQGRGALLWCCRGAQSAVPGECRDVGGQRCAHTAGQGPAHPRRQVCSGEPPGVPCGTKHRVQIDCASTQGRREPVCLCCVCV